MNYREIIARNRKKTKIVLFIYVAIYTFIGLLVDVILYDQGELGHTLRLLLTFKIFPIATSIMFAVAFMSIFVSTKFFARILLSGEQYEEVNEGSSELSYRQVYNIVSELKIAANLSYMPKVYIIKANYMNAFASGWSDKNSLVAITTGLLSKLNRDEISAVLAHELTHIRNEDVKLTLVVGVLSNIMNMLVYRAVYLFLGNSRSKGAQQAKMILLVLQFVLPLITVALQLYLSRTREYMADSGAVELIRNPEAMASALRKISSDYSAHKYSEDDNSSRKAAYIFVKGDGMFSTHPSTKNRIKALLGKDTNPSNDYSFLKRS